MTRCGRLVAMAVCSALASCAAPEDAPSNGVTGSRRVGLVDAGGPFGLASDGLAVRELSVGDDGDVIATALATFGQPALDEDDAERLARNGIRLVRIDGADLESAIAALGAASRDVEAWHGQVNEWQTLHSVALDAGGRVVAVDGRVRRVAAGRLELRMRGWTLRMEDGPRFQLELVPEHTVGARNRLATVLARDDSRGQRIEAVSVELLLQAGSGYALTFLDPVRGLDTDVEAIAEAETSRSIGIGPNTGAPATVGELLFRERPRPMPEVEGVSTPPVRLLGPDGRPVDAAPDAMLPARRRVYILVPRVPAHLVPDELA